MQPPSGPRSPGNPPPDDPPSDTPPLGVPAVPADPPWTAQPPGQRRAGPPPPDQPPGGRQAPPPPDFWWSRPEPPQPPPQPPQPPQQDHLDQQARPEQQAPPAEPVERAEPAAPDEPPPPEDRGIDVFIRRAVVGDAKAIALLIDRADARYAGIAPPQLASAERMARWDRLVRAPSWWAFVATEPGRLLGVVSGTVLVDADGEPVEGITHVDSFAVEPERWGLGIGRQLLLTATSAMPQLGWRGAELWTQEPNARARRLYESTGWRQTGVRRWHPMAGCHIIQYSIALPPHAR